MPEFSTSLLIDFDFSPNDGACLCVSYKHGDAINVIKITHGEEALLLYNMLVDKNSVVSSTIIDEKTIMILKELLKNEQQNISTQHQDSAQAEEK